MEPGSEEERRASAEADLQLAAGYVTQYLSTHYDITHVTDTGQINFITNVSTETVLLHIEMLASWLRNNGEWRPVDYTMTTVHRLHSPTDAGRWLGFNEPLRPHEERYWHSLRVAS
ncbi:unnamed protein product [Danaus chrysippus]|uniref:(African queen) hypothetical protein n=1 Tax=Danaus chrysippus TaxID=151541 RepID=A0A8J2Q7P4_9NEOP|nr:unnamed protein product [Danaus chrysippus]